MGGGRVLQCDRGRIGHRAGATLSIDHQKTQTCQEKTKQNKVDSDFALGLDIAALILGDSAQN